MSYHSHVIDPAISDVTVDRRSRVPLYVQVAEQMEQAIVSGALPPGTRLPNELDLAENLRLSRPTMRQAIAHLVDQGLLVRRRGVGTQVVRPPVRRSLALSSLYDDLSASGQDPTTVVRDLRTTSATVPVAEALGIAVDDPVIRIRRLRGAGGAPLALLTNFLPADLVDLTPGDLERDGLYPLLRAAGIQLRVADQSIGARAATAREAAALEEEPKAALLTMTRTAYDDNGRAVEHGRHVYRASRYSFDLTLVDR